MRISRPGAASAARVNSSPMPTVIRSDSPITRSTARRSPLPQYCAASTDAPLDTPKSSICSTKATCPARDEAASAAWLTKDSMITSAELTAASIKFCRAIGPVMRSVRA